MPKALFTLILACGMFSSSKGQTIQLSRNKPDNAVKVVNGNYTLYLANQDLVAAIAEIDEVMKTDHHGLSAEINAHKWTTVDMKASVATEATFLDFLRSNLGCYLLYHGKATIFKGTRPIISITAEDGPPEVEDDGSSAFPTRFTEKEVDEAVFLGHMSTKLK